MTRRTPRVRPEILAHYARTAHEQDRFTSARGQLEFERSKELIGRFLPGRALVVYDVGGGPGAYSSWLARLGHEVHLVDPVPLHIRQATRAAVRDPASALTEAVLGDARHLTFPPASADVVLLMGPLYHLTEAADRRTALAEAYRVLRPGGLLFAVGVSRFTSMMDGSWAGHLSDPGFVRIVRRDLRTGRHQNPRNVPAYWTTAFFTHPHEMENEVRTAGFRLKGLFAVEGFVWWVPELTAKWRDAKFRARLLGFLRATEREPTLIGLGPHLMCVALRPRRSGGTGRPHSDGRGRRSSQTGGAAPDASAAERLK